MVSSSSTVPSAGDEVIDRFLNNADVWQAIFDMLLVKDRIRLEMTNKRLGILMFEYWKRVTSFDSKKCLTEMSYDPLTSKNRWAAFASICVNRISDGLRSLTISEKLIPMALYSDNLRSINEGCPNVETINFVFEDEDGTLHIRFDSFSRLRTMTVSPNIVHASASIFQSIPTSIEVIRGLKGKREEPFENAAQIEGFFAHRPSLREVCFGGFFTRDKSKAGIFRVIAEQCPYLKSITLSYSNCIDYSGVVALQSVKELRIPHVYFDEMDIVTICDRSPLVEALDFFMHFSSNIDLQSTALKALGALTKLGELRLYTDCKGDVVAPSLVTEFVRACARNSGASLRILHLGCKIPLPTAAIEALANGCAKLRYGEFYVCVGETTPASIRFLIDSIVTHPSWIPQTGERTLVICIYVICGSGDEYIAGSAAFHALAEPAANLPTGVHLKIFQNQELL